MHQTIDADDDADDARLAKLVRAHIDGLEVIVGRLKMPRARDCTLVAAFDAILMSSSASSSIAFNASNAITLPVRVPTFIPLVSTIGIGCIMILLLSLSTRSSETWHVPMSVQPSVDDDEDGAPGFASDCTTI